LWSGRRIDYSGVCGDWIDADRAHLDGTGPAAMAKRKKASERRDQPKAVQEVVWPTPFRSIERLPTPRALIVAWKPLINGWDIVLGRKVIDAPEEYTHWLPMIPRPK